MGSFNMEGNAWISNYFLCKLWDVITNSNLNCSLLIEINSNNWLRDFHTGQYRHANPCKLATACQKRDRNARCCQHPTGSGPVLSCHGANASGLGQYPSPVRATSGPVADLHSNDLILARFRHIITWLQQTGSELLGSANACKHVVMCQNMADIGSILASGWHQPGYSTLRHISGMSCCH